MGVRGPAALSAGVMLVSLWAAPAQAEGAAEALRTDQGTLEWLPCEDIDPVGDEALECATLTVPMAHTPGGDGDRALGDTVRIALSRVRATDRAEHTLLVNPGGPGSPGRLWASRTHARMPPELREVYDVVAFDPRGTGASTPSISCDPGHFAPVRPDTVPAGEEAEAALRARAEKHAAACAENTGPLLEHVRTEDTARDMDAVRAALGLERIDYLGYSYGSYLGTVYSALHPGRVRALVLDSAVDPDTPWYESNLRQSRALDRAARSFFAWTARHDGTYGLGATEEEVAKAYQDLRAELASEPIGSTVGPTELEGVAIVTAYSGQAWLSVADALSAWITRGDPAPLLALHEAYGEQPDTGTDNAYGGYLAVQCTDAPWPGDWGRWRADAEAVHDRAPFMGWHNIWYNAPCAFWQAQAGPWFQVGDGAGEHRAHTGDALIVHATGDGATPVEGALALRERLPGSVLVVEEGGRSHGVSLTGNTCVDAVVSAYLLEGRLPVRRGGEGADLSCEARPEPRPTDSQDAPGRMAENFGPLGAEHPEKSGVSG